MDRALVLDANILIRAVLGRHVFPLLERYRDEVEFWTAEVAFSDARRHLLELFVRRGGEHARTARPMETAFGRLEELVLAAPSEYYAESEADARRRLLGRDESDWPYVALAMKLQCPIWTEDQDFFGTGIPTWTSDRVEIFLSGGA